MTILLFKCDLEAADRLIRSVWGDDIDPNSVDYDTSWKKTPNNVKRFKNKTLERPQISFQNVIESLRPTRSAI